MNHKRIIKSTLAAGALAVGMLASGTLQAGADPIVLDNPSFELGTNGTEGWTGNFGANANGWGGLVTPYGNQFAALLVNYGQTVASQDSTYMVQSAGEEITLSVAIGNVSGQFLQDAVGYTGLVNITIGDQIVSANVFADTTPGAVGGFGLATATYTTTADDIGQSVGVLLGGDALYAEYPSNPAEPSRYSVEFDNVQLSTSASTAPEPSTLAMLLGGMSLMMILRARRKLS
jgi:hypothetical protein